MTAAQVTLCFPLRTNPEGVEEVLLGVKKTGMMGTGKVVGIGGHVEVGESVEQAICREVAEESTLIIEESDLVPAGTVDFVFPAKPAWDMFATVFLCRKFVGEPEESSELRPVWYPVNQLPHERMWADATHWVPAFLAGQRRNWRVVLNDDNETVASSTHNAAPEH
ncbi:8-oxo-dGTP diphosphatase [Arthrobacter sp. E3]|uniref:8-oxo-dGTP diphosphatase n=1 Tax=Arthrobacter sp. E3 TaxID=517402 RepID=UPI001A949957|nr:8-oxo-dGTP diphosphatase [Arthrobacter sp. E3]